ncbi:MAG: double-stranded RNA binding motif domain-containing protein [Lentisphaeria bacterium]
MENPIIVLAELVQKKYGKSIETLFIDKVGPDHCPTVSAGLKMPSGDIFTGEGKNKREAKQDAAKKALKYYEDL